MFLRTSVRILLIPTLWLCAICGSKKIKYCRVDWFACMRLLEEWGESPNKLIARHWLDVLGRETFLLYDSISHYLPIKLTVTP